MQNLTLQKVLNFVVCCIRIHDPVKTRTLLCCSEPDTCSPENIQIWVIALCFEISTVNFLDLNVLLERRVDKKNSSRISFKPKFLHA